MPYLIVGFGILLLVTAYNNTTSSLASQLGADVFGQSGYLYWIVAVLLIGAMGYYKPLKPLSNAFLLLIVIVLVISNYGIFAKLQGAVQQINTGAATAQTTSQSGMAPQQAQVVPPVPSLSLSPITFF